MAKVLYEAEALKTNSYWVYTSGEEKQARGLRQSVFDCVVKHLNDGKLMTVEFVDWHTDRREVMMPYKGASMTGVVHLKRNDFGGGGAYRDFPGNTVHISCDKKLRNTGLLYVSPAGPCEDVHLRSRAPRGEYLGSLYHDQWMQATYVQREFITKIVLEDKSFLRNLHLRIRH